MSGVTGPSGVPSAAVPAMAARYRCDHDIAFTVRFLDGSATLDAGPRGTETLMRDAGGTSAEQTVYSSTNVKAEFGLAPGGRGAVLHYAEPALEAHCEREPG